MMFLGFISSTGLAGPTAAAVVANIDFPRCLTGSCLVLIEQGTTGLGGSGVKPPIWRARMMLQRGMETLPPSVQNQLR